MEQINFKDCTLDQLDDTFRMLKALKHIIKTELL